ncbi:MAG: 4-hydroxybenzoate octaprenyltransferase [Rhodobacteraceae bacterium]|nr:MAG: 4-hydroxybenzoate octaprenyltransferase [Paracoccaceae bacterium]
MSDTTHTASPGLSERVADAPPENWVDTRAPAAWRPYLRLSRADRPIGWWLLLIPCWQSLALAIAAEGFRPLALWLAPAFLIGAVLMRGAGCVWNDVADRDFDGRVARTRLRPIPSGQVTVKQALAWGVAQALAAFLILLTFNRFAILLGVVSLLPVVVYPFMKRFTWWPQVFLGVAFNWGALMGWACYTGGLGPAPVLLYLAGIAWTLHYDTIYAHQDKEDDALIGVKSTARLFGPRTKPRLALFAGLATVLAGAAAAAALSGAALAAALVGVAVYGLDMARQIRALDIDDPAACLVLFRANRTTGLTLVVAFLVAAAL